MPSIPTFSNARWLWRKHSQCPCSFQKAQRWHNLQHHLPMLNRWYPQCLQSAWLSPMYKALHLLSPERQRMGLGIWNRRVVSYFKLNTCIWNLWNRISFQLRHISTTHKWSSMLGLWKQGCSKAMRAPLSPVRGLFRKRAWPMTTVDWWHHRFQSHAAGILYPALESS